MSIIKQKDIENLIIKIRKEKVILDSDVASIYGLETKRINEAVKNNPDKFPEGYILEVDKKEWSALKSKFSSSIKGGKVKLPNAFTETGSLKERQLFEDIHSKVELLGRKLNKFIQSIEKPLQAAKNQKLAARSKQPEASRQ